MPEMLVLAPLRYRRPFLTHGRNSGGGRHASWSESPIANLIPETIVEEEPVTGIEAEMRIEDRKFPAFEGFDFSTLRKHTTNKVIPNPGAEAAASAAHPSRSLGLHRVGRSACSGSHSPAALLLCG